MPTLKLYMSAATYDDINENIDQMVKKYSKKIGVEEALIRAVMAVESANIPDAKRYEPLLKNRQWYTSILSESENKNNYCFYSMGLMQTLYGTAKIHGFSGSPHELLDPGQSIKYGTMELKRLITKYYYLDDVISSYNQGTPRKYKIGPKKGKYKNQVYVDAVLRNYKKLGGKIK